MNVSTLARWNVETLECAICADWRHLRHQRAIARLYVGAFARSPVRSAMIGGICVPYAAGSSSLLVGLGADRKGVRNNQGPLSDALTMRLSHPSPACGRGAGGEGQYAYSKAPNRTFAHSFCPPLNRVRGGRGDRLRTGVGTVTGWDVWLGVDGAGRIGLWSAPRQARRAAAWLPYSITFGVYRWHRPTALTAET
jgi:hypothetical protein